MESLEHLNFILVFLFIISSSILEPILSLMTFLRLRTPSFLKLLSSNIILEISSRSVTCILGQISPNFLFSNFDTNLLIKSLHINEASSLVMLLNPTTVLNLLIIGEVKIRLNSSLIFYFIWCYAFIF